MDRSMPWWLRAYVLLGASRAVVIGLTGLLAPAAIIVGPLALLLGTWALVADRTTAPARP